MRIRHLYSICVSIEQWSHTGGSGTGLGAGYPLPHWPFGYDLVLHSTGIATLAREGANIFTPYVMLEDPERGQKPLDPRACPYVSRFDVSASQNVSVYFINDSQQFVPPRPPGNK